MKHLFIGLIVLVIAGFAFFEGTLLAGLGGGDPGNYVRKPDEFNAKGLSRSVLLRPFYLSGSGTPLSLHPPSGRSITGRSSGGTPSLLTDPQGGGEAIREVTGGAPAGGEAGVIGDHGIFLSPFNGNLTFVKNLYDIPLNGNYAFQMNLCYNGSADHTSRISEDTEGRPSLPISFPEWTIEINGVAVQAFNFENRLVNDFDDPDEHSFFMDGYDKYNRDWMDLDSNLQVLILESACSLTSFFSGRTVESPPTGGYAAHGFQMRKGNGGLLDYGFMGGLPDHSKVKLDELYTRKYFLFKTDGTLVTFQEEVTPYIDMAVVPDVIVEANGNRYPKILLPVEIRTPALDRIVLEYDYVFTTDPGFNGIGRKQLTRVKILPYDSGDAAYLEYHIDYSSGIVNGNGTVTVRERKPGDDPDLSTFTIDVQRDGSALNSAVASIVDPEGRTTSFAYESYDRSFVTIINGINRRMDLTFSRLDEITIPEGARSTFTYCPVPKTGGDDFVYDTVQGWYYSNGYVETGRDPFFTNMVSSRYVHLDGSPHEEYDEELIYDGSGSFSGNSNDNIYYTTHIVSPGEYISGAPPASITDYEFRQFENDQDLYYSGDAKMEWHHGSGWEMRLTRLTRHLGNGSGYSHTLYEYDADTLEKISCTNGFSTDPREITGSIKEVTTYESVVRSTGGYESLSVIHPNGSRTTTNYLDYCSLAWVIWTGNEHYSVYYYRPTYVESVERFDSTDTLIGKTEYLYDLSGQMFLPCDMIEARSCSGTGRFYSTSYTYASPETVERREEADGRTTIYHYPARDVLCKVVDTTGSETELSKNFAAHPGKPTLIQIKPEPDAQESINTVHGYNHRGQVVSSIGKYRTTGYYSATMYDSLGRLTRLGLPGDFDGGGAIVSPFRKITYIDPNCITEEVREGQGNLTKSQFKYNSLGQLIEITRIDNESNEVTTVRTYDWAGNLAMVSDPDPGVNDTVYRYDAWGRLIEIDCAGCSERPRTITYEYVHRDETPIQIWSPLNSWQPDGFIKETHKDENNRATVVYKDLFGHTFARSSAGITGLTQTNYDWNFNPVWSRTPGGRESRYSFDWLGRLETASLPDFTSVNKSRKYWYDCRSSVRFVHEPSYEGTPSHYRYLDYDGYGRLSSKGKLMWTGPDPFDAGQGGRQESTGFHYDVESRNGIGRLCQMVKSDIGWEEELSYDARGRIIERSVTMPPVVGTKVFTYDHNKLDQVTRITYPDDFPEPTSQDILYGFDGFGRLCSIGTLENPIFMADYDLFPSGRLQKAALGSEPESRLGASPGQAPAASLNYAYDKRGRLTKINNPKVPGSHDFGLLLQYRDNSQIKTFVTMLRKIDDSTINYFASQYSYDAADRLTTAHIFPVENSQALDHAKLAASYDNDGNFLSLSRTSEIAADETIGYSYVSGEQNRLEKVIRNGANKFYEYDATGNVTRDDLKKVDSIAYNEENLITSISYRDEQNAAMLMELDYDAHGNRIRKSVIDQGDSTALITYYLYSGNSLMALYDWNGELQRRFVHGKGGVVAEDLVANGQLQDTLFHLKDHLGTTRSMVDTTGAVVFNHTTWPFGKTLSQSATHVTLLGFTGKELDEEVGYANHGARYYDATTARWLQPDPLAELFPSWSPYNYVLNDPVGLVDRNGKNPSGEDFMFDEAPAPADSTTVYIDGVKTEQSSGFLNSLSDVFLPDNRDEVRLVPWNGTEEDLERSEELTQYYMEMEMKGYNVEFMMMWDQLDSYTQAVFLFNFSLNFIPTMGRGVPGYSGAQWTPQFHPPNRTYFP